MDTRIITNFEQNLIDYIFNDFGVNEEHKLYSALKEQDLKTLIITNINYRKRNPVQKKRTVYFSKEILKNGKYNENLSVIQEIKTKFENGENISPYLSKASKVIFAPNPKNRYADKDLLLNDWNINHLHLGENIQKNGFVQRTKDVLFCRITKDSVYFIDILSHNKEDNPWTEKDLLRIIRGNWINLMPLKLNGITGLSHYPTKQEYLNMRLSGVSVFIELDGEFYIGGIMSSGHSREDVFSSGAFLDLLEDLRKLLIDKKEFMFNIIHTNTGLQHRVLEFDIKFDNSGFYFEEKKSKLKIFFKEENNEITEMRFHIGKILYRNIFVVDSELSKT